MFADFFSTEESTSLTNGRCFSLLGTISSPPRILLSVHFGLFSCKTHVILVENVAPLSVAFDSVLLDQILKVGFPAFLGVLLQILRKGYILLMKPIVSSNLNVTRS